jgi:hypothetical protein
MVGGGRRRQATKEEAKGACGVVEEAAALIKNSIVRYCAILNTLPLVPALVLIWATQTLSPTIFEFRTWAKVQTGLYGCSLPVLAGFWMILTSGANSGPVWCRLVRTLLVLIWAGLNSYVGLYQELL